MSKSQNSLDWGDLEEFDRDEIDQLISGQKGTLSTLENERRGLRAERKDQVEIVKTLRSVLGKVQTADSGRKRLLSSFHKSRKLAQKKKKLRDSINELIPPPTKILLEWLNETHSRLTTIDNDLTSVPMLNRELDAFSRFFEIQSAIKRKSVAELAHSEYASHMKDLKAKLKQLDQNKDDVASSISELEKGGKQLGKEDVNRKEVRKISNRISFIDKRMDEINIEKRITKKELGRIEAYHRISFSRKGRVKISDIKDIAVSGGMLTTAEIGALLDSGSLSNLEQDNGGKTEEEFKTPKKKIRRLGVSRRGSRKGNLARRKEE